jgi:hypothetical protein
MSEKRPNVIPTQSQIQNAAEEQSKLAAYEAEKAQVINQIYSSVKVPENVEGDNYNYLNQNNSAEIMMARTAAQLEMKNTVGVVKDPLLSEKTDRRVVTQKEKDPNEDLLKLRDEQLAKNRQQTQNYQKMSEEAMNRQYNTTTNMQTNQPSGYNQPQPSTPAITQPRIEPFVTSQKAIDPYILELSQPNYNAPFDVIPLPSKGKVYKNKKESIRLSYMTTADENILTSPNLLQSGEFLEILINRKILEPSIRYKDLLPGDRNAIMLWLRATAYGEMYPVTLLDEFDEPFDTEINLNELKTIELNETPDEEGLFYFQLPLSKAEIKFKLLTMGDVDDIERIVADEKERNIPINNTNTYKLERMIVEVNGVRDRVMVRDIANSMRISDARAFNEYINSIESGIDLNINVETPGGGSIATFLPLNFNFFWPDFRV